jgi:hypothetical protein
MTWVVRFAGPWTARAQYIVPPESDLAESEVALCFTAAAVAATHAKDPAQGPRLCEGAQLSKPRTHWERESA